MSSSESFWSQHSCKQITEKLKFLDSFKKVMTVRSSSNLVCIHSMLTDIMLKLFLLFLIYSSMDSMSIYEEACRNLGSFSSSSLLFVKTIRSFFSTPPNSVSRHSFKLELSIVKYSEHTYNIQSFDRLIG